MELGVELELDNFTRHVSCFCLNLPCFIYLVGTLFYCFVTNRACKKSQILQIFPDCQY